MKSGALLHESFEERARRSPGKAALVSGSEKLTYAEVLDRVEALAGALSRDGVGRGDRVALFLENGVEFAIGVHAALRIGAVFVPVSAQSKSEKLTYILHDIEASAALVHAHLRSQWEPALERNPAVGVCLVAGASTGDKFDSRIREWPRGPAGASPPESPSIDQDLAAIIFTSGSAGAPKGVMLTHHNMMSAWRSVQAYLQLRETDVIGLALPSAFSYGLYYLLMGLGLGATVVLERSFALPAAVLGRMAAEHVTVFPGVPMLFSSLLGQRDLVRFDWRSLRILTNAAAALPGAHLARLRAAFPQAAIFSMYGLTECKRVSYLPPGDIDRRPGSVGRGMPNQDCWLVDEQGRRLPNGSIGELVVRGSHVMRGYWKKPVETAKCLRPGALPGETILHTGDLFRTDADGYLYFLARMDDIIKSRGEKVSPREVEEAILALPGVQDVAVVGVPDERYGQAVKAFLTLRPGAQLTAREVIRFCLARLESHMAPTHVEFVRELPRTDSGKIRHAGLR